MNRPPRLSLDQLRAFRAAAAQMSFTRAARDLHVTQSAISHSVRTLEEQLGKALFHRVNRALKLTHAGEALYRAADDALALIDAPPTVWSDRAHARNHATTVALASTWLVPSARGLRARPPAPTFASWRPMIASISSASISTSPYTSFRDGKPRRGERLVEYLQFPVCSPKLAGNRNSPYERPPISRAMSAWVRDHRLRTRVVRLGAMGRRNAAGVDHASQYDAIFTLRSGHQAAINGSGVAIGKWPHLAPICATASYAHRSAGSGSPPLEAFTWCSRRSPMPTVPLRPSSRGCATRCCAMQHMRRRCWASRMRLAVRGARKRAPVARRRDPLRPRKVPSLTLRRRWRSSPGSPRVRDRRTSSPGTTP